MHTERCNLPEPVAIGAVTSCGICSELYQAVFIEAPVPVIGAYEDARVGTLMWVRLDEVPEAERTIEAPEWGDPPVQSPNQVIPDPVVEDEDPEASVPVTIDFLKVPYGPSAPLTLDLGNDVGIIVQPQPDTPEGEVRLNVVSFGGIAPEVVAWFLGLAAEQLTMKIRVAALTGGEI